MSSDKMKEIKLDKVTLNIGTGEPGDRLDKAMKLLRNMTGMKPVSTKTQKRIPTWKIRPGLQIGCRVTLRKEKAREMLNRLLLSMDNKIDARKFDSNGNFSFGIKEYLDIPGVKYDPEIGIIGLEAAVTLKRPGFRIKSRRLRPKKVHKSHLITKDEAIEFIKKEFKTEIVQ
ncbi:50S ribosomal protein L5 [Candidatus Woesearchaeota archaeon]|nr:50S ribosomal protein L5 [Candidatus Woesearchaeota archaeon]